MVLFTPTTNDMGAKNSQETESKRATGACFSVSSCFFFLADRAKIWSSGFKNLGDKGSQALAGPLPSKLPKMSALILLNKYIHPLFGFPGSTSISDGARPETRPAAAPHEEEDAGQAFGSRNAGTGFLLLPVLATRKAHFWATNVFNKCVINHFMISQRKGEAERGSCERCRRRAGSGGDASAPWCSPKAGAWRKGPHSPALGLPELHTGSALLSQPSAHTQKRKERKYRLESGPGQHSGLVYVFNLPGFAPKAGKS